MPAAAVVLLVQAVPNDRAFLSDLLVQTGYAVRPLVSGEEVLSAAADELPALVVLDVRLPGLNGYEVCRRLREAHGESVSIMFVSGEKKEPSDRVAGLLVGADDYLVAPFDPAELVARARRLAERARSSRSRKPAFALDALTARENEVLALLSRGYRADDIASELFISPKTVATHIQHVIKKLGVHDRTQAVAAALNSG